MKPTRRTGWVSRLMAFTLLLMGLLLIGVMMQQVGLQGLREGFSLVGPWLLPYLMLEAIPLLLHTAGWASCFPARRLPLPFWRLLLIRLSGSSIDEVTPTAMIGGEVVRVLLLEPWMSPQQATSTVVINKASISLAKMIFLSLGLLYVTQRMSLPAGLQLSIIVSIGLISLGLIGFVALQRYGALSKLVGRVERLGIVPALCQRLNRHLLPLDNQFKTYYTQHFCRYLLSLMFHFAAYIFEVVKTYVLLHGLLGEQAPGIANTAMITVLVLALDQMFFFVPGRIGTLEGSRFVILSSLGIGQVYGLAFGLLARLDKLIWSGMGLLVYTLYMRDWLPSQGSKAQLAAKLEN